MLLTVSHDFLPKQNSTRAAMLMDHFGIDFEQGRHTIAENLEVPVRSGDIVLFTGASGSGKSSLMRAAATGLRGATAACPDNDSPIDATTNAAVIDLEELDLGERILIDRLPLPFEEGLQLLSACGLGEAHLQLRSPSELSDGQRYRFRLALALSLRPQWIVADEFTATLDRTLAKVIAFNIHRLAERTGAGFLLATTHEDVIEDLAPNVHVRCRLDGDIQIERSEPAAPGDEATQTLKKKRSPSPPNFNSPPRPKPTGRTLLGGIIGVTMWGFPGL